MDVDRQQNVQRIVALADNTGGTNTDLSASPLGGAVREARSYGWKIFELRIWGFTIPDSVKIDGLITQLSGPMSQKLTRRLRDQVPNTVSLVSGDASLGITTVVSEEGRLGRRAAEYFLDRGFVHFAVCGFFRKAPTRSPTAIRQQAYIERLRADGINCGRIHTHTAEEDSIQLQEQLFRRQLSEQKLPLALFCVNDRMAARACHWCLQEGLSVPEQVAILGVGNNCITCECADVPLSSIDRQVSAIGAEAAKVLMRMMDGGDIPAGPIAAPIGDIVTRRSTDIVAVGDLTAARAIRYIWDHYTAEIDVNRIATTCGVSRRTLTEVFRRHLGRSVNEEINRRRLFRACELLVDTDLPAIDVAARTGFRSAQHFNRKFKCTTGLTPLEYRTQERTGESATRGRGEKTQSNAVDHRSQ